LNQIRWVRLLLRKCGGGSSTNCNVDMRGGESFVDDLNWNGVL
jgi:hypothetical protein